VNLLPASKQRAIATPVSLDQAATALHFDDDSRYENQTHSNSEQSARADTPGDD